MAKTRLDVLLVKRGLAHDCKEARALLMKGVVLSGTSRLEKPGQVVDEELELRLKNGLRRYVSRGGLKLAGALHDFGISPGGLICLDLGASTGGFTDCLLQQGARKVYAFDVGRSQLHWKLQQDPRVVVCDSVNVRNLRAEGVPEPVQLITIDVSFISLRLVLPGLKTFAPVDILALVKPQFEAERDEVQPGGVIRDSGKAMEIVERVREWAAGRGFEVKGVVPSPIRGQKGNREYFLWLRAQSRPEPEETP